MSVSRDEQRLIAMDVEIRNMRYLFEREYAEEQAAGKKNLLLSRGIKYRINNMVRARNALARSMSNTLASRETYSLELAKRKEAVREEERILKALLQRTTEAANAMLVINTEEAKNAYKWLSNEVPIQKSRVASKERALTNWLLRGQEKTLMMSRNKLPRLYRAVKDADAIYGNLPGVDTTDLDKAKEFLVSETEQVMPSEPNFRLDLMPNFHEKPNIPSRLLVHLGNERF